MNILVVGGGGREHAIITALSKSPKVEKIWAAPGNGGISALAECFPVKATDLDGILGLAKKLNPDFVFVAPDDPLVMGMVDRLNEAGFFPGLTSGAWQKSLDFSALTGTPPTMRSCSWR